MIVRVLPLVTNLSTRTFCNAKPSFLSKSSISALRFLAQDTRSSSHKFITRGFTTAERSGARGGRASFVAQKVSVGGTTAITVGQLGLAGASALGIGALCYYGLGLANEAGAIDRAAMWPKYVRDRVKDTYLYFGASLGATAATALAIAKNPTAMRFVSGNGIMAMVLSIGAMIGTSVICRSIEYKPGLGSKQFAWLLHTAVVGAVIAPLTILGGPLLVRAAWYTAGVVGGLSTVAMCAPSDKFLTMGGPLAAGLGVVFVASLGSAFFPPTGALGMSLYSISVYGGLILFGAFLLYDTQKIVKAAESHPMYAARPYDPVNASMSIYMDAINIFIRIAMLMASGGNRRK